MDTRARCLALPPPRASCRRAADLGRARRGRGRAAAGSTTVGDRSVRDRPTALPRSRANAGKPGRAGSGFDPLGHDRAGARPGLLAAPARSARARGIGRDRAGDGRRSSREERRWPWPTSIAKPAAASRVFELAWAHSQVEHRHGERFGRGLPPVSAPGFARDLRRKCTAGRPLGACGELPGPDRRSGASGSRGDRPIILCPDRRAGPASSCPRRCSPAQTYLRHKGSRSTWSSSIEEPESDQEELFRQLEELIRAAGSLDRMDQPGGVFVLKARAADRREKVLLQAAARVVFLGRPRLAGRPARSHRVAKSAARSSLRSTGARSHGTTSRFGLPIEPSFPQRPGRIHPGRPGIRVSWHAASHRRCGVTHGWLPPRGSTSSPTPLRFPGLREWVWVYLVGQQPDQPTDTMEQRPRLGPAGRGRLFARRRKRRDLVSNPAARPFRPGRRSFVMARDTRSLSGTRTACGTSSRCWCRPNDPIKLIRLCVKNSTRSTAPAVGDILRRVGAGPDPRCSRNARRYRDRPRDRRLCCAQCLPHRFRRERGVRRRRQAAPGPPAPTEESSWDGMGRSRPRLRFRTAICPARQVRLLIPAPRFRSPLIWNREQRFKSCSCWARPTGLLRARALIHHYRQQGRAELALEEARNRWDELLGAVASANSRPALDLLANRWLLYQVLSCRIWGRSAFYQSGGAYGFRDQLQDVMALVDAAPQEARGHILRAAGRQFLEGDVQHWWHPPAGRGIRTRIADDPLWLVFVTTYYVARTGDTSILEESVPYLLAPGLTPGQEDCYSTPAVAEAGALFDHCVRALLVATRTGSHGLPLMRHGDWNDGMNRVGWHEKGESVWLGWFSIACLTQFALLAQNRGELARSDQFCRHAGMLRKSLEAHAWDGAWYHRAYFDDGAPLGSAANAACAIDSIAQSWAVLSGAGDPARDERDGSRRSTPGPARGRAHSPVHSSV